MQCLQWAGTRLLPASRLNLTGVFQATAVCIQANSRAGRDGASAVSGTALLVARCATGDKGSELEVDCAVARATVGITLPCRQTLFCIIVLRPTGGELRHRRSGQRAGTGLRRGACHSTCYSRTLQISSVALFYHSIASAGSTLRHRHFRVPS